MHSREGVIARSGCLGLLEVRQNQRGLSERSGKADLNDERYFPSRCLVEQRAAINILQDEAENLKIAL